MWFVCIKCKIFSNTLDFTDTYKNFIIYITITYVLHTQNALPLMGGKLWCFVIHVTG